MPAYILSSQQGIRKLHLSDLFLFLIYLPSLKQLDIEFMRRLHTKVNLIPIIAKSDTLTDEEVAEFKQRVSQYLGINITPLSLIPNRFWLT